MSLIIFSWTLNIHWSLASKHNTGLWYWPGDLHWLFEQDPGHGLVQGRRGQGALVCPVALAGWEEARRVQGLLNTGLSLVTGHNAELWLVTDLQGEGVALLGDILEHLAQFPKLWMFIPDLRIVKSSKIYLRKEKVRTLRRMPRTARPSGLSTASPKLPYFVLKCTKWSSAENICKEGPRVIMSPSLVHFVSPSRRLCAHCPGRSLRPSGRGTEPAGIHPREDPQTNLVISILYFCLFLLLLLRG